MEHFETITREELKEKIDHDEGFVLIDVLGANSYERAHLPGAVMADAHEDDFLDEVARLVSDKDTEVVVYCASFDCRLSTQAAQKLVGAGYTAVVDYEGGLMDWAKGGYPLEGGEAAEVAERLANA
ncbi:MAG: rhodanese-like domain-containing protein [Candidatus Paceibacterota bacterium]